MNIICGIIVPRMLSPTSWNWGAKSGLVRIFVLTLGTGTVRLIPNITDICRLFSSGLAAQACLQFTVSCASPRRADEATASWTSCSRTRSPRGSSAPRKPTVSLSLSISCITVFESTIISCTVGTNAGRVLTRDHDCVSCNLQNSPRTVRPTRHTQRWRRQSTRTTLLTSSKPIHCRNNKAGILS